MLLLGAGEMAEAAARSLGNGARALRICNRSFERAAALAGEMQAAAVPWDELEAELVAGRRRRRQHGEPHVRRDARHGQARDEGAQRADAALRRHRRAAQRRAQRCTGSTTCTCSTSTTSSKRSARGLKARHGEVAAAERSSTKSSRSFSRGRAASRCSRRSWRCATKARAVLVSELERSLGGRLKHLGEADRAALTQMIESAVNKLLHAPDDAPQGARLRRGRRERARCGDALPVRSPRDRPGARRRACRAARRFGRRAERTLTELVRSGRGETPIRPRDRLHFVCPSQG